MRKIKLTKEQYSRVKSLLNESDNTKSDLNDETIKLLKKFYGKTNDFSSYWGKHGLTYDDICDNLLDKKILIKKNGNFELSKSLGTKEEAIKKLEKALSDMTDDDLTEVFNNGDIKIFEDKKGGLYFETCEYKGLNETETTQPNEIKGLDILNYEPINNLPETRADVDWKNRGNVFIASLDADDSSTQMFSKEEVVYYVKKFTEKFGEEPIFSLNPNSAWFDKIKVMNKGFNDLKTKKINAKSEILKSWGTTNEGKVKIDEKTKDRLLKLYDKDKKIVEILSSISESESEEDRMERLKSAIEKKRAESKKWEDEYFRQRDIQNAIDSARAEEKLKQQDIPEPEEPKKPIGQYNMFGGVDEISSTGSVGGQHTTALQFKPMRKDISIVTDVPVVRESLTATEDSIGQYTATAFKMKKNHTDFAEVKPKAFKKTQWAGGSFVEFDDCVKPNNNKEAQKGGCSTGAVDNVVKLKKTKGNVNAPSLNEGMMREALKLQRDTKENKLIVVSDLEGRAASQETFTNKAVLKQNGFVWTGTNWAIPADKLDVAKKTLSLINKAEYLIDKLEDLETAVEESGADNKSLLKARLDQYISDLANATNEAALSAEIQRYLTFFSKFHSYSFYNRILIYIQRPDATKVASFCKWKEKFRYVKKDAKAIKILVPIIGKSDKSDDVQDDNLGASSDIRGFKTGNVFDISDTEPMDERGNVPDEPQWWGDNTPSETADILFKAISEVADYMGIKITQDKAKGGEKGFSAGDHINLSSEISGVGKLSTMIHEMAHELMHHRSSSIYYQGDDVRRNSKLVELQAEGVSFVVLTHYGLPTPQHAKYLALWKASKESIQANLEVISKVAEFIIKKIDEEVKTIDTTEK